MHNRQKELKIKQLQHKRHLRGSSLEEPVEEDDVFRYIQSMRKSIKNAKETPPRLMIIIPPHNSQYIIRYLH